MNEDAPLSHAVSRLVSGTGRVLFLGNDSLLTHSSEVARAKEALESLREGLPYFIAAELLNSCRDADIICFESEAALLQLERLFDCDRGLRALTNALTVVLEHVASTPNDPPTADATELQR